MRIAIPSLAIVAVFLSAPALASGSIDCEATDRSNVALTADYAGRESSRMTAVILHDGTRTWSTRDRPAQLHIVRHVETRSTIRLDLLGPGRSPIQLRVRINLDAASTGFLRYRGRSHPLTCEFG